jgi:hypothetical protein
VLGGLDFHEQTLVWVLKNRLEQFWFQVQFFKNTKSKFWFCLEIRPSTVLGNLDQNQ